MNSIPFDSLYERRRATSSRRRFTATSSRRSLSMIASRIWRTTASAAGSGIALRLPGGRWGRPPGVNRSTAWAVTVRCMVPPRPEDPRSMADEDLLALVADGDERAFAVLYDRHARPAYSLAFRLLGDRQ